MQTYVFQIDKIILPRSCALLVALKTNKSQEGGPMQRFFVLELVMCSWLAALLVCLILLQ